jgi:hypothetical protein
VLSTIARTASEIAQEQDCASDWRSRIHLNLNAVFSPQAIACDSSPMLR